jgi:hypothetical protein
LVQDIVTTLQGVPLAIDQAGAYLSIYRNLSPKVLGDFIEKLHLGYDKIMRTIPKRSKWYYEKHRSVVDTFILLRESLSRSNEDAAQLLTLSAFLAPGNIPMLAFSSPPSVSEHPSPAIDSFVEFLALRNSTEEEFREWASRLSNDQDSCYAAITALEEFCCAKIRWNAEGTEIVSFSIHNAVRLWCQESWNTDEKDRWATLAAYQLGRSLAVDGKAVPLSLRRYLWHVRYTQRLLMSKDPTSCIKAPEGSLWPFAWLTAIQFAKFYQGQGYLIDSELHLHKAIEFEKIAISNWPNDATSTATLHLLGLVLWQSGKFDEAVEAYQTFSECLRTVTFDSKSTCPEGRW